MTWEQVRAWMERVDPTGEIFGPIFWGLLIGGVISFSLFVDIVYGERLNRLLGIK